MHWQIWSNRFIVMLKRCDVAIPNWKIFCHIEILHQKLLTIDELYGNMISDKRKAPERQRQLPTRASCVKSKLYISILPESG